VGEAYADKFNDFNTGGILGNHSCNTHGDRPVYQGLAVPTADYPGSPVNIRSGTACDFAIV
jgi:hypothetical protein